MITCLSSAPNGKTPSILSSGGIAHFLQQVQEQQPHPLAGYGITDALPHLLDMEPQMQLDSVVL